MPADDQENAGAIGDESSSTYYKDIEKVENTGSYYSDILHSDFGDYLSGTVPLKDGAGNIVAFVGVDIEATEVSSVANAVLTAILPALIVVILALTGIVMFILYRYINGALKPLAHLGIAAQSFAQGDIAKATIEVEKIQLKGTNEITIFAQSFRESLQKLKETFHTIQQRTFALQNVVQKLMRPLNMWKHQTLKLLIGLSK